MARTSDTLERAKWIERPGEKADRDGQTLATKQPEVIKDWAKARDARPATATRGPDGRARTLRLDFGEKTEGLEEISWDEWLSVFEDRNLAFVFQDKKSDGSQSNFFILENPDREDG